MCFFFFSPFEILRNVILLYSPQWERAVLGEKGVVGEFQGEIRKENAWEREQIPIKLISLLLWCMNAHTIMTALHVFLQCSALNGAKEAIAQTMLWESQWICIVQMDTGPSMFHKVVSVHINRSAHEIFKIYLFIEIFNALALFMLQEALRDFRPAIN